jgi:hypothetical protein
VKLSKTSWIFMGGGVILIAGLFLGMSLMQQTSQAQDLTSKLTLAKNKLAGLNTDSLAAQKEQLTQQINQYDPQIKDIKVQLSSSKDSIDITDTILYDGQTYKVHIYSIDSPGISSENLAGTDFEILSASIKVEGAINDIANFIYSFSSIFPTGLIKSVEITVGETTEINLVIYNYKG